MKCVWQWSVLILDSGHPSLWTLYPEAVSGVFICQPYVHLRYQDRLDLLNQTTDSPVHGAILFSTVMMQITYESVQVTKDYVICKQLPQKRE